MEAKGLIFEISYKGSTADGATLNFYDAAQAMIGFQRSLALTSHLILNGEIITQAPALKGATIFVQPPESGSWKLSTAIVLAGGLYTAGTAPKDTPIGHLIASAYDYVVHKSIGVHVDYDRSLGQLYEDAQEQNKQIKKAPETKFESLIEKCEPAIRQLHRPMIYSQSAENAEIISPTVDGDLRSEIYLDRQTYLNMSETTEAGESELEGYVSGYNINTYKGRIFIPDEERTISFSLSWEAADFDSVQQIMRSMSANAAKQIRGEKLIKFKAIKFLGANDRLKTLHITQIHKNF